MGGSRRGIHPGVPMDTYKLFIDGEFVDARNGATYESIDPGTGQPIAQVARAGPADAELAVAAARRAFDSGVWSGLSPQDRSRRCYEFADLIANEGLRLAMVESMDSGQVIGLSQYWGLLVSSTFRNLGHHAATAFPWQEEIPFSGNVFAPGREYIRREPIGVCVGIMPWNFPLTMACWKIATPASWATPSCSSPRSDTPLSALIAGRGGPGGGIPEGVINIVTGPGAEIGATLCTHPKVDKIAFTGTTEVGSQIMAMASDSVKKVTLELGGKSANIVLDDADMDSAVDGAILGIFLHSGQVCESGTRVLVPSKLYDEFLDRLQKRAAEHAGRLPAAAQDQARARWSARGSWRPSRSTCEIGKRGGRRARRPAAIRVQPRASTGGCYYAPTIFGGVYNKMRIAQEEIFGPVV